MKKSIRTMGTLVVLVIFLLLSLYALWIWTYNARVWPHTGIPTFFFVFAVFGCFMLFLLHIRSTGITKKTSIILNPLYLAIILCAGVAMCSFFSPEAGLRFLRVEAPPRVPAREVIIAGVKGVTLYLAMILGMAAHWLWEEIGSTKKKDRLTLNYLQLIKPLLISPIVFLFLWILLREQPFGLIFYLIAFQNGFFWQSLLYPKKS